MSRPANAATVTVSAIGSIVFNGVQGAPIQGVSGPVHMSFTVDSNNFVDGVPGDTRGYVIDPTSFALSFPNSGVSVGLADPFPVGQTPYFTLVDGFPVSDGFFVSTSPVSPGGVPLAQTPVNANLDLGYAGTTLSSLNILDAVGDYEFAGLTRFSFTLWEVFPDNTRMEIDFAGLSIVPEPGCLALVITGVLFVFRRR
jgi:hypothetical protein